MDGACKTIRHRIRIEWWCVDADGMSNKTDVFEVSQWLSTDANKYIQDVDNGPNESLTYIEPDCTGEWVGRMLETNDPLWP